MMGMAIGSSRYYSGSTIYVVGTTMDTLPTGYTYDSYPTSLSRAMDECYYSYLRIEPARKNYRWFHVFNPVEVPRVIAGMSRVVMETIRRFVKSCMTDGRRLKRKRYLQELRR